MIEGVAVIVAGIAVCDAFVMVGVAMVVAVLVIYSFLSNISSITKLKKDIPVARDRDMSSWQLAATAVVVPVVASA